MSSDLTFSVPAEDSHDQQHDKRNRVDDRTRPWQRSRKVIVPVNGGEQESKDHQEVVHASPALVVKDAPERHEPDEDRQGALLSQDVSDAERLRSRLQHIRKQQERRSIQYCAGAEEAVNN